MTVNRQKMACIYLLKRRSAVFVVFLDLDHDFSTNPTPKEIIILYRGRNIRESLVAFRTFKAIPDIAKGSFY